MKYLLLLGLIIAFNSSAQLSWTGKYVNVQNEGNTIDMYSQNGREFVLKTQTVYDTDEGVQVWNSINGVVIENDTLNAPSEPYLSYGSEGQFFTDNGDQYYFDGFYCIMDGRDSLDCLYKKSAELPSDWQLSGEERKGESGVLDNNISYVIGQVTKIEYSDLPQLENKLIVKFENDHVLVIDRNEAQHFEAFKGSPFELSKLYGKTFQFHLIHLDGWSTNHDLMESSELEINTRTPFEITVAPELGAHLDAPEIRYPEHWIHRNLSDQFEVITYGDYFDFREELRLHLKLLSPSGELLLNVQNSMPIIGETSVFERVSCESHVTQEGINQERGKWNSAVVVADFNFDGLHDLAIMRDEGGYSGSIYNYYIQTEKGQFELNKTLSEELEFLPTDLNAKENRIYCSYPVGVNGEVEMILKYDASKKDWIIIKDEYHELD